MKSLLERKVKRAERLTEAYEVRAFRDESEEGEVLVQEPLPSFAHAEPGDFDIAKTRVQGHGEQMVIPDDCQFGDNDLCYVET